MAKKKKLDYAHVVECQYQGQSCKADSKMGVKMGRGVLSDEEAIEFFVGAELDCCLQFDPNKSAGEDRQQKAFKDDIFLPISANVKRLAITPDHFSISLVMPKSVDNNVLARATDKYGKLHFTRTGESVASSGDDEES